MITLTTLSAAKTEAGLLIHGWGYFFVCHSVLSELLCGIFLSGMFCIFFNIKSNNLKLLTYYTCVPFLL
jgi:hypothetical protein